MAFLNAFDNLPSKHSRTWQVINVNPIFLCINFPSKIPPQKISDVRLKCLEVKAYVTNQKFCGFPNEKFCESSGNGNDTRNGSQLCLFDFPSLKLTPFRADARQTVVIRSEIRTKTIFEKLSFSKIVFFKFHPKFSKMSSNVNITSNSNCFLTLLKPN